MREREGTVSLSRRQGDCSEKREAGGASQHQARPKERDQDGVTEKPAGRPRLRQKRSEPLADPSRRCRRPHLLSKRLSALLSPEPRAHRLAGGSWRSWGIPKDQGSTRCPATNRVCDCGQVPVRPLVPGPGRPLGKSGQVTVTLQAWGLGEWGFQVRRAMPTAPQPPLQGQGAADSTGP